MTDWSDFFLAGFLLFGFLACVFGLLAQFDRDSNPRASSMLNPFPSKSEFSKRGWQYMRASRLFLFGLALPCGYLFVRFLEKPR